MWQHWITLTQLDRPISSMFQKKIHSNGQCIDNQVSNCRHALKNNRNKETKEEKDQRLLRNSEEAE